MVEFKVYENCENIVDSMQIESDTTIASLKIDEQREVTIETRGSINVTFDGREYRSVSEFPKELKDIIANEERWYNNERVCVSENNWFELFYMDNRKETVLVKASECVDVEGYKDAELYELMAAYVNDAEDYEFLPASFDDFI